ncbi:aldehyde dehydrogenase iron-sulfur subunit PaoA [Tsuneonella sp. HG094]|jgi:xanthine dehydrogenase YagT iron-sulfur-binding subunit
MSDPHFSVSRRTLLGSSVAGAGLLAGSAAAQGNSTGDRASMGMPLTLKVNGSERTLTLDPRTTLLDALREHLQLTGTKKGCDHGQCGACTVIVNGERINSCLTLAVQHAGDEVTTIEGLGTPAKLHPMQDAFVEHDGYQCGYCTPGQICSAVAMLGEIKRGVPSHATEDLAGGASATNAEIRERMSGNICRCGAYSNIAEAIGLVARA